MEFHYPRDVKEAVNLLSKKSSLAVAGGTSFIARPRVEHLVDITRIGLSYIKEEKSDILIGAATTVTDLMESKLLNQVASGILCAAASTVADTQLRNVITIGGDIACRYSWACMPPALMVLDAKLRIAGREERVLPIEKFFKSKLKTGEFIKEVTVPKKTKKGRGAFFKYSRTSFDYSIVTVAAYAEQQGDKLSNLRVAVSGVSQPIRLTAMEDELRGRGIDEKSIDGAATRAAEQLPMLKSYLFDEEYRREVLCVMLKRAISKVLMGG